MTRTPRKGSMALAMLVVVVLSIGAFAALMHSQGSARLLKRVQLAETAQGFAHAAVEEAVAKIVNGNATFQNPQGGSGVLSELVPEVTAAFAAQNGVTISNVRVLGRIVTPPTVASEEARQRYDELLTAGANFAPPEVRALKGDPNADYRVDDRPEWADHPALAHLTAPPEGVGAAFNALYLENSETAHQKDGGVTQQAFAAIQPMTPMPEWQESDAQFLEVRHSDEELDQFRQEFHLALEAGAEAAGNGAGGGGCGSAGSDGGSSVSDGGSTVIDGGAAEEVEPDEDAEGGGVIIDGGEDGELPIDNPSDLIDELGEQAGANQQQLQILTLQATATSDAAGISVDRSVTEYRLVQTSENNRLYDSLGQSSIGHMMAYYELTPRDAVELGWCEELDRDGDGTPDPMVCNSREILAPLYEGAPPDSVQVAAFQSGGHNVRAN